MRYSQSHEPVRHGMLPNMSVFWNRGQYWCTYSIESFKMLKLLNVRFSLTILWEPLQSNVITYLTMQAIDPVTAKEVMKEETDEVSFKTWQQLSSQQTNINFTDCSPKSLQSSLHVGLMNMGWSIAFFTR